jgi:hypothetical protein
VVLNVLVAGMVVGSGAGKCGWVTVVRESDGGMVLAMLTGKNGSKAVLTVAVGM